MLDRYRLDPRYSFQFFEYAGRMAMSSPSPKTGSIPERDQTSVQTFGLGIDEDKNPHVCVFLRYLSQLSPEHQGHWESYLSDKRARMHVNYYKTSLLGEVYENNSGIAAVRFALQSINTVCGEVWGQPLFLQAVPEVVHYNLSPFMRPSKADFLSFVHELDKLIADNINVKFFEDKLERFSLIRHPDGTVERKQKGTLTLLEEWLFSGEIRWPDIDEARREIIMPLRRVRRERQPSAHAIIENDFDLGYTVRRREILRDVAFALGNVLHLLLTHQRAPKINMPKWFEEARIEVI